MLLAFFIAAYELAEVYREIGNPGVLADLFQRKVTVLAQVVERGIEVDFVTVYRWVHEDVIERHQARMKDPEGAALMRRRGREAF